MAPRDTDDTLVEGVIDLAYLQEGTWIVVDFETDHDLEPLLPVYTRQVGLYAAAVAGATQRPARGIVRRI